MGFELAESISEFWLSSVDARGAAGRKMVYA